MLLLWDPLTPNISFVDNLIIIYLKVYYSNEIMAEGSKL